VTRAAVLLLAGLVGAGCRYPATLVRVEVDHSELDVFGIEARAVYLGVPRTPSMPGDAFDAIEIALPSREAHVEVTAIAHLRRAPFLAACTVSQTIEVEVSPRQTRAFHLHLDPRCIALSCPRGTSCDQGACFAPHAMPRLTEGPLSDDCHAEGPDGVADCPSGLGDAVDPTVEGDPRFGCAPITLIDCPLWSATVGTVDGGLGADAGVGVGPDPGTPERPCCPHGGCAGRPCDSGFERVASSCVPVCAAGFARRGASCEASDHDNCTSTGAACSADERCDLVTSTCVSSCGPGVEGDALLCGLGTTPGSCGASHAVCPDVPHGATTCDEGVCRTTCHRDFVLADGACVPATGCTDCGSPAFRMHWYCGTSEAGDLACRPECDALWADCNGDPDDGCETSLRSMSDCSACGRRCPVEGSDVAGNSCFAGTCLCDNGTATLVGDTWLCPAD
jgi:hypothetical protein